MINKKSVLVTGVSGYTGSYVFSELRKNPLYSVKGLTRSLNGPFLGKEDEPNLILFSENERLIDELEDLSFDMVIHLAGIYIKSDDPFLSYKTNLEANLSFGVRVLESLKSKPKMVFYSNSYSSFTTKTIDAPDSFYACAKRAFGDYLRYYYQYHGMSVINCHFYDTYGPYDNRKKIIDLYIKASLSGKPMDTSVGNRLMNFVHIRDLFQAVSGSIELYNEKEKQFLNYCLYSKETLPLSKVRQLIEEITGKPIAIKNLLPDSASSLNFEPLYPLIPTMKNNISLRDGIRELVEIYES